MGGKIMETSRITITLRQPKAGSRPLSRQDAPYLARKFSEQMMVHGGTINCANGLRGIPMGQLFSRGVSTITIPPQLSKAEQAKKDLSLALETGLTAKQVGASLAKLDLGTISFVGHGIPQPKAAEPQKTIAPASPTPKQAATVNAPAKPKEATKINMLDLPKPKQLVPKRTGFQKSVLVVSFLSLFSTFASIGLVAINNFIAALPIPLLDTFYTPLIAFVAFIATRVIHGISRVPQVEKYENENALGIISYNSAKISNRTMTALKQDLIKAGLARGLMGRYDIDSGKFFFSHTHEPEKRQLYSLFEQHLMPELGIESRYSFAWAVRGGEYLLESEEVAAYGFNESKINEFGGTVRHFIPLIKFKVVF